MDGQSAEELAAEASKVDTKAALSKAITLLDAKIAAVQPLAQSDDEAKADLLDFTSKRRGLCEQMTLLKTPSEQLKIAQRALKSHGEALEKAEADLAEHEKRVRFSKRKFANASMQWRKLS